MSRLGKVAVLYGGWSEERAVSLDSGAAVHAGLLEAGVDAHLVDATPQKVLGLLDAGFERAFIVLHGRGGEDGSTQAVLEFLGLPYTGSGVAASALCMDKLRSKQIFQALGLPTPAWRSLRSVDDAQACGDDLGLPLFIKPVREGSSIGLSKVKAASELAPAYQRAAAVDAQVIAEAGISGGEYTASILGQRCLPLIEIQPSTEYYDYQAKYQLDDTVYRVPAPLPPGQAEALQQMCLRAFAGLGCQGWGRVDFMLDAEGQPWLLEANTVPGMTSHSLVPKAAAAAGISFPELVLAILEQTLEARP